MLQRRVLLPTPLFPKTAMFFRRARGEKAAVAKLHEIAQLLIEIVGVDVELGKLAARLKAEHNLPYADCFAAALAQSRKAALITSDKDFERVGTVVKILWV
jgi:predicted nucleic acid-binding protein